MDYYRAFPFYSGYQGYSRWSSAPEIIVGFNSEWSGKFWRLGAYSVYMFK